MPEHALTRGHFRHAGCSSPGSGRMNLMKVPSGKFPHVRRGKSNTPPGVVGVARVDQRTKTLVRRLKPGEVAVIDHADLDRVSADELIECKVAAVVNAAKSITGRYPNFGPQILLDAR